MPEYGTDDCPQGGTDQRTWQRGEIEKPRVSTLRKLAGALGLEPRDLLED